MKADPAPLRARAHFQTKAWSQSPVVSLLVFRCLSECFEEKVTPFWLRRSRLAVRRLPGLPISPSRPSVKSDNSSRRLPFPFRALTLVLPAAWPDGLPGSHRFSHHARPFRAEVDIAEATPPHSAALLSILLHERMKLLRPSPSRVHSTRPKTYGWVSWRPRKPEGSQERRVCQLPS